jgi:hypothetical protein
MFGGTASAEAAPARDPHRVTVSKDTTSARRRERGFMTGTRTPDSVLTGPRLPEVWHVVEPRLRRYLLARRVPRGEIDDVVQEVALRILVKGPRYDSGEDLLPWCLTVARNVATDAARAGARQVPVDVLPDQASGDDVAAEVASRLELERTLAALRGLTLSDQAAIVDGLDQPVAKQDRATSVRLAVRRHRARQRLLASLAAVTAWAWASCRRLRPATVVTAAAPLVLAASFSTALLVPGPQLVPPQQVAAVDQPALPASGATAPATAGREGAEPAAHGPRTTTAANLAPHDGASDSSEVVEWSLPTGDELRLGTEEGSTTRPRGSVCVQDLQVVPDECLVVDDEVHLSPGAAPSANRRAAVSKSSTAASARLAGSTSS